MRLYALQLASASAFALLAGWAGPSPGQPVVLDELGVAHQRTCATGPRMSRPLAQCFVPAGDDSASHQLTLDLDWKTKRTAADVLTELLDVDGIRVVADRHLWDRPDTVALRHDFAPGTQLPLFCEAGIDRAVYLESRAQGSFSPLATHRQRSVGMMAEVGASWRLTGQLNVETGLHWMGPNGDARLVRTDAGWVSGDPVTLTLLLVWRGN